MRFNRYLLGFGLGLMSLCSSSVWGQNGEQVLANLDAARVLEIANDVADWQLANPGRYPNWDWTQGALWTGMSRHALSTGEEKYFEAMREVSSALEYKLGPRKGFGDDHCVGQLHLWHYLRDQLPGQLAPTYDLMSEFIKRPHDEDLLWREGIHLREWAWCDVLYMSPPTLAMLYAATGERRFLEVMDELWWRTTDYLFDAESGLYWRDSKYFDSKEANGEKVFWSRGNGWVFAGLCHVLQYMPADFPSRERYEGLFKVMAAKLKSIQQADGSWRASLLDPESFPVPESSGTAFFTYGFLWGINQGLLDRESYLPAALKAWERLIENVHDDGKLGFVQPVGEDPREVTFDQTDVYGVGGFLQVAHELHKFLVLEGAESATVTLSNPSKFARLNRVVEIPWAMVEDKLPGVSPEAIGARDLTSGYFVPTQVIGRDAEGRPAALLVQVDAMPYEGRKVDLLALGQARPKFRDSQLMARKVPERKDDFTWENDRVGFRMYGPALAVEGSRGGVDVWSKSVRTPVVNKWYAEGGDSYHKDRGEGLDGYKVGSTLGCGGVGYLNQAGELVTSEVYAEAEVLENGPLRLVFELKYNPIEIDGAKISEVRRISMDAGNLYFTVESSFSVTGDASGIKPVGGLVIRDPDHKGVITTKDFFCYWDNTMAKTDGFIGTFIINEPSAQPGRPTIDGHFLKVLANGLDEPVKFHAGATWEKADTPTQLELEKLTYAATHDLRNPIGVD